jgi:hypothetical protein
VKTPPGFTSQEADIWNQAWVAYFAARTQKDAPEGSATDRMDDQVARNAMVFALRAVEAHRRLVAAGGR